MLFYTPLFAGVVGTGRINLLLNRVLYAPGANFYAENLLLCMKLNAKWRKGAYKLMEKSGFICPAFKKVVVGLRKSGCAVAENGLRGI